MTTVIVWAALMAVYFTGLVAVLIRDPAHIADRIYGATK